MGNAIWLFLAVPSWFFGTILNPFGTGLLSLIPAFGVLCLLGGIGLGIFRRRKGLLFFLVPFFLSELLAIISGIYRGTDATGGGKIVPIFLVAEILIMGFLIYHLKGARTPAVLLTLFCIAYALFASFVAGMSFSDTWL